MWFQYTGNYKHPSPQKDIRHWWLLLFNVSSLFSFCEGTIGTCAHLQVCAGIPPSLLWRGVHFMAVDRSWSQKQLTISKLTVEKNCINSPQQRMDRPSLMTLRGSPVWKELSCLGYLWSDGLGFLSPCWIPASRGLVLKWKTPEEYSTRSEGCTQQLIAALSSPFLGSTRYPQRRFKRKCSKQEKTLKPQAVGHGISHWEAVFASLDTFFCFISSIPNDSHWGKQAIKEALTRLRPSRFQTETSPCSPKFNPDPECKFSPPAPPHAWQVVTSGRCQVTLPQPGLLNEFSLWQRSGCKSGQMCWPS